MKAILDHIDRAITYEKMVYVHCWGGIGRTGTVVGCYLVRHGLSGPEALERLQILRRETAKWWRSSPETDEQRAMILSWQIGE
jgi:protein-tyrosine phosphatase